MKAARWLGVGFVTLLLLACQTKKAVTPPPPPPPPAPQPATPDTLSALRAAVPNALIGRVVAVLPDKRLAAVSGIPVQRVKVGQHVSFMGNEGFLTGGEVVTTVDEWVHVKWEPPPATGRAPIVGDLCMAEIKRP